MLSVGSGDPADAEGGFGGDSEGTVGGAEGEFGACRAEHPDAEDRPWTR